MGKQAISRAGQAILKDRQNAKSKKLCHSRATTKETRAQVKAPDPHQKVQNTAQKVPGAHNKSARNTKETVQRNNDASSHRSKFREEQSLPSKTEERPRVTIERNKVVSCSEPKAALKKKRALPEKVKANPDAEKKRSKAASRSEPKAASSREKRVLGHSPGGFTSDSSEDSGDMSEDLSDSDDSVSLSDSSDESDLSAKSQASDDKAKKKSLSDSGDESDLSAKSQASGDKAKKISFTQSDSPNRYGENGVAYMLRNYSLLAFDWFWHFRMCDNVTYFIKRQ